MQCRKLPSFPEHSVAVKYATEHRCGVRVRGPRLTDMITGTDPLKDKYGWSCLFSLSSCTHICEMNTSKPIVKCAPTDETHEAKLTSDVSPRSSVLVTCLFAEAVNSQLINELSDVFYEILSKHPINDDRRKAGKNPANSVLLRGCGSCIDVCFILQEPCAQDLLRLYDVDTQHRKASWFEKLSDSTDVHHCWPRNDGGYGYHSSTRCNRRLPHQFPGKDECSGWKLDPGKVWFWIFAY